MKRRENKLPYEVLQLVEWVLREYPRKEEELGALDRFITDRCHARAPEAEAGVKTRPPVSVQERILEEKERSDRYRWLQRFIDRIEDSLAALTPIETAFVECYYWEGMTADVTAKEISRDRRTVFRIRNRILSKMALIVLPEIVYPC